jgi:tape measure domain-containing protein
MPTADEVEVILSARVGKYEADLKRSRQTFDKAIGGQEQRIQMFERQMQRSSNQISGTLRSLAGVFAAAFSARQLVGLADGFTRLQNNLRVTGLEGEKLAQVQSNLLGISQQYGVDVETLSGVFLKASLAQDELGASTEQIIRLNEIVAASLKVTGTSAEQARGALLQLGQAIGSDIVRGEEFNSLLENALPVVQAAARGIDRFEGSVTRLRKAVVDGAVTSREFFEGILRGGTQTIEDAEKATLTLAGGFEALTSTLTVYFGEADKANGVSAALGAALKALADNIETIIPALAAVATGLGVGFVTNAVRARIAAAAASTAMGGLALAARGAGAAILSAFGGPVGAAILGIGAAIYYAYQQTQQAERATGVYAKTQQVAQKATDAAAQAAERLASAHGKAREEALALARAEQENIKQKLASARASQALAQAELARATARYNSMQAEATAAAMAGGEGGAIAASQMRGGGEAERRQAAINLKTQIQNVRDLQAALKTIDTAITSVPTPAVSNPGKPKKIKKANASKAATGPSAADIERRYLDELDSLRSQMAGAEASIARSADERAELELRQLENARRQTLRSLDADEDYSEAQKARVRAAVEAVALAEREVIEFNRRAAREREAVDLADDEYRAREERLRLEYDLATTEAQRRDIALRILDAEDAYLRAKLEAVIASETATEAEQERARIALASLENTSGARRRVVDRAHQGPLGRYADGMADPAAQVEEAVARKLQAVNEGISDALTDALGTDDQFVKDLFSIFLDQVIFKPLAEALDQAGGGDLLGGLFSSVTGAIFGRATGGPVRAGQPYVVGENGREVIVPQQNGVVVPNHRLQAQSTPPVVNQTIVLDARYGITTPELIEYVNGTAKRAAADAGGRAYQQSMKDAPGALRRAERYGK